MCGRYFINDKDTPEQMKAILKALERKDTPVQTGEIFPSDCAAVIANTKCLSPAPFSMRWGYLSAHAKRIINVRSETAAEKTMFADGMKTRRCLIPASGYYEWTRRSREKTKYAICNAHSGLLYMAGIYRLTPSGTAEFAILTRAPGESLSFLHDRMPVILPHHALADWLNPACDPQRALSSAITDLTAQPLAGQAQTRSFFDPDFDS